MGDEGKEEGRWVGTEMDTREGRKKSGATEAGNWVARAC